MSKCIFCKIINGEMKSYKIFENEEILAFLDIMPVNPGHTLIVPKKHYENILEMTEELLCGIMKTIKKIAPAILSGVHAESFNMGLNNGKTAGQLVSHVHFHLMPRFPNDGHNLFRGGSYADGEAERLCEEINANLAGL